METKLFDYVEDILGSTYTQIAREARNSRTSLITSLLAQRQIPLSGLSSLEVKQLLLELAAVDSNCQRGQAAVGEREGRVYSDLVKERNFHFAHGIGRSGDISALQPKAVGSSLLYRLTCYLALDAVKMCGIRSAARCLVLPMATGMTLSLCLSAMRMERPQADVVVLSRIDQKACIKAVVHAGLKLYVVDQLIGPDGALGTDIAAIGKALKEMKGRVLCVVSTTSTFAPRQPDSVPLLAELCKRSGVFHLVNNAYGLQCSKCCGLVEQGCRVGGVDLIVSSCDKNFLTPVGGALVYGYNTSLVTKVSEAYPGRANVSPVLDLFITLLQMAFTELGRKGLQRLLSDRLHLFRWFHNELSAVCHQAGLRVLPSPHNNISIAVDLSRLVANQEASDAARAATFLGSQLFLRRCSGLRVVVPSESETQVAGHKFRSFGSHCVYPVPYAAAACAIGADKRELELFLSRFLHLVDPLKMK